MNKAIAAFAAIFAVAVMSSPVSAESDDRTNQRFVLVFEGSGPGELIASGAVSGRGKAIPNGANEGTLTLPGGTISLTHAESPIYDKFNPTTCLEIFANAGTFKITGGTGRYAGVTGGGTQSDGGYYRQRPTNNGCSDIGAEFFSVVHMQGHLDL